MTRIKRREFLEQAMLAGAAASVPTIAAPALGSTLSRRSPNETIRVGVIGVRGRGRGHIAGFLRSPDSEVVAICDPDEGVIDLALEAAPNAKYHRDLRSMLDDPTIDAVSIAAPNHWHSLATIWALQAGKHVFVEKPISHNVFEGRQVVRAAEKYGKVVQHGTQSRSHKATREAIAWLQSGGLGRIKFARGLCYKRRESIGLSDGPIRPPASMDFNLWTGPAQIEAIRRPHLHYDWHWDFNTGNGDIGNQGPHQMDIARWGLGLDRLPNRVTSCGGRFGYVDAGETANTQIALFDYGDATIIFEVRGLPTPAYKNASIGTIFHCEHGYMVSASYAKVVAYDHDGNEVKTFTGGSEQAHYQNFLDAIKAGEPEAVHAPAIDGHRTSAMSHLANISWRLGTHVPLSFGDPDIAGSDIASEAFLRCREHLISNGIDASTTQVAMGPTLEFDTEAEQLTGEWALEANAMLTRPARPPFAVPTNL